jgi:hypothetical protein
MPDLSRENTLNSPSNFSREEHEENNIIKTPFNKKFWEVQEPFFKRVPGRRRHRLTVNPVFFIFFDKNPGKYV